MLAAIKSEFRKLLTVRSTYVILFLAFVMLMLFAFFAEGVKGQASGVGPDRLSNAVLSAVTVLTSLAAIVGILLVTHEYRYNMIMYSLTSTRRRLSMFAAKVIVITIFTVLFVLVTGTLSPLLTMLGANVAGYELGNQSINTVDLLWRTLFYGWATAMIAICMAFVIRNQAGALIVFFFVPGTIELLLGFLLRANAEYLPFRALNAIITNSPEMTHAAALGVVSIYLVVFTGITAVLLQRRDAN